MAVRPLILSTRPRPVRQSLATPSTPLRRLQSLPRHYAGVRTGAIGVRTGVPCSHCLCRGLHRRGRVALLLGAKCARSRHNIAAILKKQGATGADVVGLVRAVQRVEPGECLQRCWPVRDEAQLHSRASDRRCRHDRGYKARQEPLCRPRETRALAQTHHGQGKSQTGTSLQATRAVWRAVPGETGM